MKVTISSLVLQVLPLLLFTSTSALDEDPYPAFPLRAWNNFRRPPDVPPPGPIFNHYAELDQSTGEVIVNATAGWAGFDSYIDPTPEGNLRKQDDGKLGFLFPLWGTDGGDVDPSGRFVGHFALNYGHGIPRIANVLFSNFTTVGRGCGGHCGGSTLDYDEGEGTRGYGTWYLVPRGDGADGVWLLRWTNLVEGVVVPSGGWQVFLWKN